MSLSSANKTLRQTSDERLSIILRDSGGMRDVYVKRTLWWRETRTWNSSLAPSFPSFFLPVGFPFNVVYPGKAFPFLWPSYFFLFHPLAFILFASSYLCSKKKSMWRRERKAEVFTQNFPASHSPVAHWIESLARWFRFVKKVGRGVQISLHQERNVTSALPWLY